MRLLKSYRRNMLQFSLICLVMLVFIAPLAWLSISHPAHIQSLEEIIAQNHIFFLCFRLFFIIGIFLAWPRFIYCWGTRRSWSNQRIRFWQHQRFKIVLWLVLFELVLCDNLLLKLIHVLGF